MDENKIREVLTELLSDIAQQAKIDALAEKSNIGSIYDKPLPIMKVLDEKKVAEAILDIKKATATKELAARLMNAVLIAAKTIALTAK